MSNNRLELQGLRELRDWLRQLPDALAKEGGALVRETADEAAADIRGAYPRRTGALADHVVVTEQAGGRYGAIAAVTNTSELASEFEYGTQARHTRIGANRGSMPPGHVFVPRMMKHRARLLGKVKALLEAHGFEVHDA